MPAESAVVVPPPPPVEATVPIVTTAKPLDLPSPPIAPEPEPPFAINTELANTSKAAEPEPPIKPRTPTSHLWQTFTPRSYPMMQVIITVLYVFAGLTALSCICTVCAFLAGGIASLSVASQGEGAAAASALGMFGALTMIISTLIVHAIFLVFFMASAESIRLWLDIQANTQEAAYYARLAQIAR